MKFTHFLALCASCFLLVSCQNTVNTVENADKHFTQQKIYDTRIETDGFLYNRLHLGDVTVTTTQTGLLCVQVPATNNRTDFWGKVWSSMTGSNPYPIRYKFDWFDEKGSPVNTIISDWQEILIAPGQTVYLTSVAPSPQCKDFKLNLKEKD